jgi:regulator of RNase E activity RraA
MARGVAGAIIDGGCRDLEEIRERGFFIASRDVTPRSGKRRIRIAVRRAVTCGGVRVRAGDGIVADQTGIVAIPAARLVEALAVAEQLQGRDALFVSELDAGQEFGSVASRLRHV